MTVLLSRSLSVRTLSHRLSARIHERASTSASIGGRSIDLATAIDRRVECGELRADPAQRELCIALESLRVALNEHRLSTERYAGLLHTWRETCEHLAAEAAAEEARRINAPAGQRALERVRALMGFEAPRAPALTDRTGASRTQLERDRQHRSQNDPASLTSLSRAADGSPAGMVASAAVPPDSTDDNANDAMFRRLRLAQAGDSFDAPALRVEMRVDTPSSYEHRHEDERLEQHPGGRLSIEELHHPFWRSGLGAAQGAAEAAERGQTVGPAASPHGIPATARTALPPGAPPPPERPASPRGLFIHGDVGSGKTLALDMFARALLTDARGVSAGNAGKEGGATPMLNLRRVHHEAFMIECHQVSSYGMGRVWLGRARACRWVRSGLASATRAPRIELLCAGRMGMGPCRPSPPHRT
jgi:hypothetical protein